VDIVDDADAEASPKKGSGAAAEGKEEELPPLPFQQRGSGFLLAMSLAFTAIVWQHWIRQYSKKSQVTNAAPELETVSAYSGHSVLEVDYEDEDEGEDDDGDNAKTTQWLHLRDVFGSDSDNLLIVDTDNFNATVSRATTPLLVAYCDPRSMSFRDLRPHLEQTAAELAAKEAEGNPIGRLAVSDVTLDTWLAHAEAPEMTLGWQAPHGAFRFGVSRFFPVIIKLYLDGQAQFEYKGVVSAPQIVKFLERMQVSRNGNKLDGAPALRDVLEKPGPSVVGCGLPDGSNASKAFSQAAKSLMGTCIFGIVSADTCDQVFGPPAEESAGQPRLIWVRGEGSSAAPRVLGKPKLLEDAEQIVKWVGSHRIVQEMTPDNSHVFLDGPEPLVVFLVQPNSTSDMQLVESVVTDVETLIEGKGSRPKFADFRFTWSDCKTFGNEFKAKKDCMKSPVIILVHPLTLQWEKAPLQDLLTNTDAEEQGRNVAFAVFSWLDEKWEPWRRDLVSRQRDSESEDKGTKGSEQKPESQKSTERKEQPKAKIDAWGFKKASKALQRALGVKGQAEPGTPSANPAWYSNSLPALKNVQKEPWRSFHLYHAMLVEMADLRESFEASHAADMNFDFSEMEAVQKQHPDLRLLPRWREIRDAFQKRRTPKMWARVERHAQMRHSMEAHGTLNSSHSSETEKLAKIGLLAYKGLLRLFSLFQRFFETLHAKDALGELTTAQYRESKVDRRDASELSVREFFEKYAFKARPVIITGLKMSEQPWTLDYFAKTCNTTVELKRKNDASEEWGMLESAELLPLADFIGTFRTNESRKHMYLHDWPLPLNCPQIFGQAPYGGFYVPKYFAGDYFQRSAFTGYQHTWPSLFVGSELTESALHIDSGNTNFWMYLLSGKKEWRFYDRKHLINLYAKPLTPHFYTDVFRPEHENLPLLKYAEVFVGIQEPGDLIYIPGGNPHGVRNLAAIHGISMNFVDASNVWLHLQKQLDNEMWREFESFTDNTSVPHGLSSTQKTLTFGEWKSRRWKDNFTFDIDF